MGELLKRVRPRGMTVYSYVLTPPGCTYLSSRYMRPSGYYRNDILSDVSGKNMEGFSSEGFKYLNAL